VRHMSHTRRLLAASFGSGCASSAIWPSRVISPVTVTAVGAGAWQFVPAAAALWLAPPCGAASVAAACGASACSVAGEQAAINAALAAMATISLMEFSWSLYCARSDMHSGALRQHAPVAATRRGPQKMLR